MPEGSSHVSTISNAVNSAAAQDRDERGAGGSDMPILIDTPDVVSASRLAALLAPVECELFPSGKESWRVQVLDSTDVDGVLATIRGWLAQEELTTTGVVLEGGRRIVVSPTD